MSGRLRGTVRAVFRRDRVTGQIAIGLVGVLVVSAVVYGVGVASARYELSDVGAWLGAPRKGQIVHANGPAAKVDGKAELPASFRGHRIKIVQDGATVLIVDLDTGVVSRIDPSQLSVDRSRTLGGAGLQVVAGAGRAYVVDSVKGRVQQIDPVHLTPWGQAHTFAPPLGQAGVDAEGTLWVPAPQTGRLLAFAGGRALPPVTVGRPGARLELSMAAGEPVVVDATAGTATVVRASGGPLRITLPSTVRDAAGGAGVFVPPRTEARTVPVLVPGTGSLLLLDTGTGRHTSTRLSVPGHRYAAPQILGAKVYIPDQTAGTLLVYDSATGRFDPPVTVTGRRSTLEVFVKDGLLWAHDPDDDRAVVVDRQGVRRPIEKYEDKVPGGGRRSTLPTPREQGPDPRPGPTRETDRPPASSPPPRPGEPQAPSNLTVTPGAGTMRVDFQPSAGGRPTGYALKDAPGGLTVSPARLAPGAGVFTFTARGGDCAREYRFRVAVQYRDAQGRAAEKVSAPSDPVRPCVPPGAPRDVKADATASGAKVSWTPPAGEAPSSYRVTWTGPASGAQDVASGTSVTIGSIATNGSYSFTVSAANAAGAGNGTAVNAQLTGPAASYPVERNGKSDGYVRARADHNSANVATMHDNNGQSVSVHCQEKGTFYTHPNDSNLAGDMYTKITFDGKQGYVIAYLVDTPGDWKAYSGLPVWRCA